MSQEGRRLSRPRGLGYHADSIQHLNALYRAGLARDAAQTPALLAVVADPPNHFQLYTALHALGQIGEASVVPAIEASMQGLGDEEAQGLARAVRARLLAEAEAGKAPDVQQKAQTWVRHFLHTLHTDTNALNAAVAHDRRWFNTNSDPRTAEATFALRELADRIYRQRDAALLQAAKQAGVEFSVDAGAGYKVQLALLTSQQRVNGLVNTLANKKTLQGDDNFLLQLAADEGNLMSMAVTAKLKEMDQHRDKYADTTSQKGYVHYTGYAALFRVLRAINDKVNAVVVADYLQDREPDIRYYADQAYQQVKAGIAWKWAIGY